MRGAPMTSVYDFAVLDTGIGVFLTVYAIVLIFAAVFGIVCYVFQSIALYTIAKRRRIHHPWLSWIPIGECWILGSIADQYQYVVRNRVCSRRKVLLGLSIATAAVTVCQLFAYGFMIAGVVASSVMGEAELARLMGTSIAVILLSLALVALAIATLVFKFIACYDLFTSCNPDTKVVFLVLGIVFGFLMPFFFFADRKKDNGMPPRTDELPPEIPKSTGQDENRTEFL